MSIINMDIRTLKTTSEAIKTNDNVIFKENIPELHSLLAEIKNNIQKTYNMDEVINRIIKNITNISSDISFDLSKLETFIKGQIRSYQLTEEEAIEELNIIVSKMASFATSAVITDGKIDLGEGKHMTDADWDKSPYIKKESFQCKCGGKHCNGFPVEVSKTLIEDLNNIRQHFGKPMIVTSGIRCGQHNSNIGGASGSRHTRGLAADFYIEGVSASEVAKYVQSLPNRNYSYTGSSSGYAQMDGIVHYDVD